MKVLVDIAHPAHAHFFRIAIGQLRSDGHDVLVTSRDKECTLSLLDSMGIEHDCLGRQNSGSMGGMATELIRRNISLYKVVRKFEPDVMGAIGGIFVAQVGRFAGVRSVVFYDTENAKLQNILTYPFASKVVVPECYSSWVPPKKAVRYAGFHELAYLHPEYFKRDIQRAAVAGASSSDDTFVIRLVSWQANHDIGETGLALDTVRRLTELLSQRGTVLISSEMPLPDDLIPYQYKGGVNQFHHVLAYSRLVIGESATVASESVMLGTPAIYIANTSRGYIDQLSDEHGLLWKCEPSRSAEFFALVERVLSESEDDYLARHQRMLAACVDVPSVITEQLLAT